MIFAYILVLPGAELPFLLKDQAVLWCSVFVAGKVLLPHQPAGCCWAVPAQHQGSLSKHHIKGQEVEGGQGAGRVHS